MFEDPRPRHWHSKRPVPSFAGGKLSPLRALQDDFVPHPVTEATVVLDREDTEFDWKEARRIIRRNKLRVVNYGLARSGIAVTFRNRVEVSKFVLLYPGRVWCGRDGEQGSFVVASPR